ncbi:MAG: sensor histidine kinase, partial [Anaerolineae bacterium]|nr:sensor histidine kinase [Anaerolineae bacterium]
NLQFLYHTPQSFSAEDIQLAMTVGQQVALVIENTELREQAAQAAILRERNRLARDLHDSVTQSLYSLTVLAEAGRRLARDGNLQRVEEAIARLGDIGQQTLKEMRLLLYQLRPTALRKAGLIRALQQRLNTVERRAGVEARLHIKGQLRLSPTVEEHLYHIIQEALNNTLKHAEASTVIVRIVTRKSHIRITITDNGKGFNPTVALGKGGIGLLNMRERAEQLNGTLNIQSEPGRGTKIRVTIPSGYSPPYDKPPFLNNVPFKKETTFTETARKDQRLKGKRK